MKNFKLTILALALSLPATSSARSFSVEAVTLSSNNTTLEVFRAKTKSKNLHLLINGGMHGNERLSPNFVKWLMKRYTSGTSKLNKLNFDFSVDFLPVMNRDGFTTKNRYNKKGVNLNRNFPVLWGISRENPGIRPASEGETQMVMELFESRNYDMAIDVHGYVNWIVGPTSPELMEIYTGKKVDSIKKSDHKEWTGSIKKNISFLPGYEYKSAGGLGDGGAFEDYAYWSQNAKTFCLEISISAKDPKKKITEYLKYEKFVTKMIEKAHQMKSRNSIAVK